MGYTAIIKEVLKLLEEGKQVTLTAKGNSMLPFIIGERERIVLIKPTHITVGDIVLACIDERRYVIHRVIKMWGQNVTLMGDGNLREQEHCQIKDIAARAEYVVKSNNKKQYLYTWQRRWAARLWFQLLPLRRYLLAVYRRI